MQPDWATPAGRALTALAGVIRRSGLVLYIQVGGRKSALWENTEKLWPRIFGRSIDVRGEIVEPVLAQLAQAGADRDYLDELRTRLGL